MPIIRIKKRENPYVQIDRAAIEDNRLSWRARGILAYLLSKPDEWHIHVHDIVNHGTEGREAVQKSLKELQKFGYAKLQARRNETGQMLGKEWVITEEPINGFSVRRQSPTNGIPDVGDSRQSEKPLYSNNNKQSNNKQGGDADFEKLWQQYGLKKGSKKNAASKWQKLSAADRAAIWATLDFYKRETVTEDTSDRAGKFKPMRKHLERFLAARTWEAYVDRIEEQKNEQPTPYDEAYEKYLHWVEANYPALLRECQHLSKPQFQTYKTPGYVRGSTAIGQKVEFSIFTRAHENKAKHIPEAERYGDVFSYHCALIEQRVKERQI